MQASNTALREANRESHYGKPLLNPDPLSHYAFVKRGLYYADRHDVEQHPSAIPFDELYDRLWDTAEIPLIEIFKVPPEIFRRSVKPYAVLLKHALVGESLAHIMQSTPNWTDRERASRAVVAVKWVAKVTEPAKLEKILNAGARSRGARNRGAGSNGLLTRHSIKSAEATFQKLCHSGRVTRRQIILDLLSVRAMALLEKRAAKDNRFAHLKGECLADAIEEHAGIAKSSDRAIEFLYPGLPELAAQNERD